MTAAQQERGRRQRIGQSAEFGHRLIQGLEPGPLGAPIRRGCFSLIPLTGVEQRRQVGGPPGADVFADDAPALATGTGVVATASLSCLPAHPVVLRFPICAA